MMTRATVMIFEEVPTAYTGAAAQMKLVLPMAKKGQWQWQTDTNSKLAPTTISLIGRQLTSTAAAAPEEAAPVTARSSQFKRSDDELTWFALSWLGGRPRRAQNALTDCVIARLGRLRKRALAANNELEKSGGARKGGPCQEGAQLRGASLASNQPSVAHTHCDHCCCWLAVPLFVAL